MPSSKNKNKRQKLNNGTALRASSLDGEDTSSHASTGASSASRSAANQPAPHDDDLTFRLNLKAVSDASSVLSIMHPLPTWSKSSPFSARPTVLACEQSASSASAALARGSGQPALETDVIKIASWNVANLGGGFGYPARRHPNQIERTATILQESGADIIVILEVLDRNRPYPRRSSFRLELSSSGHANRLILKTFKDYTNFLGKAIKAAAKYAIALAPNDGEKDAINDLLTGLDSGDLEQRKTTIGALFDGIGTACLARTGNAMLSPADKVWMSAEIAAQMCCDIDENTGVSRAPCAIPVEYGQILELSSEIKPARPQGFRNQKRLKELRKQLAKAYKRLRVAAEGRLAISSATNRPLMSAVYSHLFGIAGQITAVSNEAQFGSHNGLRELQRIGECLRSKGSEYEWFAGRDPKTDDPRYTAGETYGFFFKRTKFDLADITLCDFWANFSGKGHARAPQIAWFHLKKFGSPLGVIAYHPPSNSPKHKHTRGVGFKLLMQHCQALQVARKGIVMLAFDSNIDTTFAAEGISNCTPPMAIKEFFGDWLDNSIFTSGGTSLRKSVREPLIPVLQTLLPLDADTGQRSAMTMSEVNNLAESFLRGPDFDQVLSAFDKIVPVCTVAAGLTATVTAEAIQSIIQPDRPGDAALTRLTEARLVSDHQLVTVTLSIEGPRAQVPSAGESSSSPPLRLGPGTSLSLSLVPSLGPIATGEDVSTKEADGVEMEDA